MAYLNTTGLAVGMMLLGIENTGMHITSDGRLVDYRLRPGIQANPQSANGKKTAFTDKEVELLRLWMATSSDDTHLKISPFETLENVLPTHTFLAWKSKWKEGGVQKLAPVTLRTDAPYKNLKSSEELVASAEAPLVTTISPDTLTTPSTNESICIATKATTTLTPSEISTSSSSSDGTNPCVATEPRQPTVDGGHGESKRQSASQPGLRQDEAPSYYELRADRLSNILRELDIEDEAAFERWLAQPFVRSAYNEVFTSMIVPEIANTEAIRALDQRPCYNETASTLNSRVAKAMDALGNGSSKFLSQNPDKSGWMKDDHSVRFIVSMVSGGRAPGSCWNRFDNPKDQEHLCQKALLLLRWLQWVYRPAGGSSLDSIRRQVLKDDWRAKLAKLPLCNSKVTANPPSPPSPGGLPPVPMEQPTITPTANDSTLETSTITLLQEISDRSVRQASPTAAMEPRPMSLPSASAPQTSAQTPTGLSASQDEEMTLTPFRTRLHLGPQSSTPFSTLSALAAASLSAVATVLPQQARALLTDCPGLSSPRLLPVSALLDRGQSTTFSVAATPSGRLPTVPIDLQEHGHSDTGSHDEDTMAELGYDKDQPPSSTRKRLRAGSPHQGEASKRARTDGEDQQAEAVPKRVYSLTGPTPKPAGGVKKVLDVPDYPVTLSDKQPQMKGAAWLSAAAYKAWQNEVTNRLAGWGVGPTHMESCVLVPEAWKRRCPSDLLEGARYLSLDENLAETGRMTRTYGDATVLWARAAAWFSVWPRRGVDLDVFVGGGTDNDYGKMHGSHRCHQGLCIVPGHICWERDFLNLYRNSCKAFARQLRRYGMEIPVHCRVHDPPCLLQHAALTATEAVHIQFFVLREAKSLPESPPPTISPPDRFETFEYRLPLSFKAESRPSLSNYRSRLVRPPDQPFAPRDKVFMCPFCDKYQQGWGMIDRYWAHLRDPEKHGAEVPNPARLQAVIDSGTLYLEWQARRAYDYTYNNKRIAEMVQQTQLDNFDWETFQNWTLHTRKPKTTLLDPAAPSEE